MKITVQTTISPPLERVWEAWTTPADIVQWNFASDDWCCPSAKVDLRVGGSWSARMEAKDGSFGFDFEAVLAVVEPCSFLQYSLGDDRVVEVRFSNTESGVLVEESFDAEDENSAEMQRAGWQAILDNFRKYVEGSMESIPA